MSTIDLAPPRPGVVDQHVDAAEMLNSASDERLHVIFLGDVTDYRVHFTELGRLLLESPFVPVADDDARTLFQAALRNRRTDSGTGRRGHHDNFVPQQVPAGRVGRHRDHGLASFGSPSTRSAMMLRWISLEPP
jgi:hypothetical protein